MEYQECLLKFQVFFIIKKKLIEKIARQIILPQFLTNQFASLLISNFNQTPFCSAHEIAFERERKTQSAKQFGRDSTKPIARFETVDSVFTLL